MDTLSVLRIIFERNVERTTTYIGGPNGLDHRLSIIQNHQFHHIGNSIFAPQQSVIVLVATVARNNLTPQFLGYPDVSALVLTRPLRNRPRYAPKGHYHHPRFSA
ncbi:hypothetical protein J3458_001324 [Metarhizium acridum]|uniref:uncharacterized protein n=1 Tax=Metarhizium acridum TaxID=92637 RepID=UPI001C6C3401|nr:hypothetical protein J3458_001324 [Metarhizium acridum]